MGLHGFSFTEIRVQIQKIYRPTGPVNKRCPSVLPPRQIGVQDVVVWTFFWRSYGGLWTNFLDVQLTSDCGPLSDDLRDIGQIGVDYRQIDVQKIGSDRPPAAKKTSKQSCPGPLSDVDEGQIDVTCLHLKCYKCNRIDLENYGFIRLLIIW